MTLGDVPWFPSILRTWKNDVMDTKNDQYLYVDLRVVTPSHLIHQNLPSWEEQEEKIDEDTIKKVDIILYHTGWYKCHQTFDMHIEICCIVTTSIQCLHTQTDAIDYVYIYIHTLQKKYVLYYIYTYLYIYIIDNPYPPWPLGDLPCIP